MLCNKTWYMFPLARQPDKGTWHSFKKKKKKKSAAWTEYKLYSFFFPSEEVKFESPMY